MLAVAFVTRNRVISPHYPDTYCEVIKEGPMRESWKTRKDPDLPDDQRVFFQNVIGVSLAGIVMVKLTPYPHKTKTFMN